MARTKQTARKTSGDEAPRKIIPPPKEPPTPEFQTDEFTFEWIHKVLRFLFSTDLVKVSKLVQAKRILEYSVKMRLVMHDETMRHFLHSNAILQLEENYDYEKFKRKVQSKFARVMIPPEIPQRTLRAKTFVSFLYYASILKTLRLDKRNSTFVRKRLSDIGKLKFPLLKTEKEKTMVADLEAEPMPTAIIVVHMYVTSSSEDISPYSEIFTKLVYYLVNIIYKLNSVDDADDILEGEEPLDQVIDIPTSIYFDEDAYKDGNLSKIPQYVKQNF